MPPNLYPSMPPHLICSCSYFTSISVHAPYVVANHSHITSLGCLNLLMSRLPPSIFPNLLPPDKIPRFSGSMS